MSGWIKTYRSLADHWLAEQPEKLGWWVLLLLKAAHEDKIILIGNQLVELKRGQINISFSSLSMLWKTSKASAERFIELLEKEQMISREVRRKVSIITICNYESYQDKKRVKRDDDEPKLVQSRDTNKEDKEDNNINNKLNSACACEEKVVWDAERERGFCEAFKASGKPMALAREIKSGARGIMIGLERFMSFCEVAEIGHKDTAHFGSHFRKWMLNESVVEVKEQTQPQPQRRVTTNEDTYRLMQEMGWQNS